MMIMDDLIPVIIAHEGLKLLPYTDTVGKLTIGVGRNLTDRGISHDEAMQLLNNDLAESHHELSVYPWFNQLDEVRQGVIIELHFNIGLMSLLQFKMMIGYLQQKYFPNAANQLLKSKWATQVGPTRANNMASRLSKGVYP